MFEMLGNWSLGDYGPHESLAWSLELLTDGFGLDSARICVTVFAGDDQIPFDQAAHDRWMSLGIGRDRIFRYGREHNWWGPPGPHGPCGPDSEIFYWVSDGVPTSEPALDDRWLEIWNNVFITYELTPDGRYLPLAQPNVDTGMGLERITTLLQQVRSVYETDLLAPIMDVAQRLSGRGDAPVSSLRIVCDHLRAATFLAADGVRPSNVEHGYVLRRLVRRAIRHGRLAGIDGELTRPVAVAVIDRFGDAYPHLAGQRDQILDALQAEERTFLRTLVRGLRELQRLVEQGDPIDGSALFWLFETHGLPPEVAVDELRHHGVDPGDWARASSAPSTGISSARRRTRDQADLLGAERIGRDATGEQ